ncbi:2-octaprenyl-6-methoxyphenyl hydroxylase [Thiohalobacter sp. IOR34]|uniref:2-octaprenyl-6-methoxyphenyl hydroxylase n=1 Tax=Thiohalobacter sp. IOR34 TaxID=3057176 RepID=UPI0025B160EE|nr:2-octaprenyl-6-methoxyphenyl hydroxylase [Thiohalobacter sp. IOR34]WJW75877.1 2-octaprenyl-6-methoxyphenyl hydroxylase [Thiohalobacter sp. IOR34]
MTDDSYDILIAGGGLVGASLACALGGQGLRIGLIEAHPFEAADAPGYDDRAIALAQGSQCIFQGMGLWPALAPHASPIERIHISDRGRFGFARLDAGEAGVAALGYVALGRDMGVVLGRRLAELEDVELLCPARFVEVALDEAQVQVDIEQDGRQRRLGARLLVAADGSRSPIREQLGIATRVRDYGQTALIANVTPQRPHRQVAYERFTDSGPLALLPLDGERCALVWTLAREAVDEVLALDDAAFLAALQDRFGYRLGRFLKVGRRDVYPLSLLRAREAVRSRLALIGNAAHTLHPIAGQGFNLGLRDVAALAEVIVDAVRAGEDPGALQVLDRYAGWRAADQRRVMAFTELLLRLFGNPLPPVAWARDLGLLAFDLLPPLKRQFGRLAMGRAGRLPRLARGLELGLRGQERKA